MNQYEFDEIAQSETSDIPKSLNGEPLELGDFVCPRYMATTAKQAIDRGFVYQITEINQPGTILTVQRVSDPRTRISASSDFFISLQEQEDDADNETESACNELIITTLLIPLI
ncbi:hypothetical protein QUB11_28080 [Microcoleus sp. B6-A1]|uniref:hypothetical protein n=1 Tax=unclassified Microcoleus TaxID=2642155 RepID=UPI002FD2A75E